MLAFLYLKSILIISLFLPLKTNTMRTSFFTVIAKVNKTILPSFTKRKLDISKASKVQLAIIGWRAYVTKNALH